MESAYILHRYPYKERDVIVKVWLETGIKTAVMRGVKKLNSPWRALAQPFVPIQIKLRGRGEVLSVTHCEATGNAFTFKRQLQAMAFYLNELMLTFFVGHEVVTTLFVHYDKILSVLQVQNEHDSDTMLKAMAPHMREFEMHLFDALGHGIHLAVDADNHPIDMARYYHVQPGALPIEVKPTLTHAISGQVLWNIQNRQWNPPSLAAAKYLCRQWVDYYSHGKQFKSRTLFNIRKEYG